jgi:hypothetical protein
MLAYTAPLGPCKKDLLTPCHKHRHRWQQMMRHARMLPPGNTPWPDAIQLKEMFVHTFPRVHRAKYFSSKDIDSATETIDTITLYMKGLMEQDQADGTLQRLLEKHTRRKTAAYDSRKSRQRREKGRRQDLYDQRQYDRRQRDRYERSHRSSGRDDRRSERRDDREGRSRKYSRREDGRREARDERRSTRNDDDVAECPKHGKVGHTWEQCRQNPDNWKKAASAKSKGKKPSSKHSSYKAAVESHYQSDEESRRSDDASSAPSSDDDASNSDDEAYFALHCSEREKAAKSKKRKLRKVSGKEPKKSGKSRALRILEDSSDEESVDREHDAFAAHESDLSDDE